MVTLLKINDIKINGECFFFNVDERLFCSQQPWQGGQREASTEFYATLCDR